MSTEEMYVDISRAETSTEWQSIRMAIATTFGRKQKMWVVLWRETGSRRSGALKCPGKQTREEAAGHARALRVLFPERTFQVGWMEYRSGKMLH